MSTIPDPTADDMAVDLETAYANAMPRFHGESNALMSIYHVMGFIRRLKAAERQYAELKAAVWSMPGKPPEPCDDMPHECTVSMANWQSAAFDKSDDLEEVKLERDQLRAEVRQLQTACADFRWFLREIMSHQHTIASMTERAKELDRLHLDVGKSTMEEVDRLREEAERLKALLLEISESPQWRMFARCECYGFGVCLNCRANRELKGKS